MKRTLLNLSLFSMMVIGVISCGDDKTKLEKLEEELEQRSDDLEDAADDIGNAAEDIEDALKSFEDALQEVENAEDRAAIRERVNKIFDEMDVRLQ
ncbi:hypothetical protein [Nonlabens ponticola]|uniref:YtxH domain-containing protein n=1 Tax=Nonlabens ponticola TaxID=2496866 RepID=A0A3S9MYW6_9FLAO|nr:hypothetical protein [Nonlabens ponticola]AZQ44456.1 hypothetical protein EJ995_09450 [Nonlabens ponticola]